MSFVYGLNSPQERLPLWEEICSIAHGSQALPWVLLGDHNVVRSVLEKMGGDLSWIAAMDDLNACCSAVDIEDLKFSGH